MNKFLTALINDKAKLFKIICIFLTIVSSIACGIISNSIVIALLPAVIGFFTKEIIFVGISDFVEKMFSNPVPNCLGVLIVYSLIKHISKYNEFETIYSIIKSKNHFCDVVLQFSFILSFLNAINYTVSDEFKWTNFFNSIHLFVIVFCGAIVTYVFSLRLISKQPFKFSVNKVYPTSTLVYVFLFLLSCGFSPILWGNAKHEVILLVFNSLAALIVIWFLFYLIKNVTLKMQMNIHMLLLFYLVC